MDTKPIQPRPILDSLLTDNNTEIVNNKPTIISKGLRKYRAWLQRMERLEVAGSPSEAPGANGLTINDLPDDMLIHILSMMDIETLLVVAKVCAKWQQLFKTPHIWKYASLYVDNSNYEGINENILPFVGKYLRNAEFHDFRSPVVQLRNPFVSCCPNLTHLKIEMLKFDGSILDDLPHWPNLKFLRLTILFPRKEVEQPRHAEQHYVATNLKNIEIIYVEAAQFIASLISYCPNLTHFKIHGRVDRSIFNGLHHLPNLKFLSLSGTTIHIRYKSGDRGLCNLPFEKMKYLETVILSHFPLTRESLYCMLECENLVNIDMRKIKGVPADFLKSLVSTKQSTLKALYIDGDTLNDNLMRHISNCRQLQVLWIRGCDTLSDSSLLHLSNLKNLQSLELWNGDLSENVMLAFISNSFKQMTYLRIPIIPIDLRSTSQVIERIKINFPILKSIVYRYRYKSRKVGGKLYSLLHVITI